jgi:hypothetical protein
MYITGEETDKELLKCCSSDSDSNTLHFDGACLTTDNNCGGNNILCLKNFGLEFGSIAQICKTLPAKSSYVIKKTEFNQKAVAIISENIFHKRILDEFSYDNVYTLNYVYTLNTLIDESDGDKIKFTLQIDLDPDNTSYVAAWDSLGSITIGGQYYTTWNELDGLSWFNLGSTHISNLLKLPKISMSFDVYLYKDNDGGISNVFTVLKIPDDSGKIIYELNVKLTHDGLTDQCNVEILDVKLVLGQFLDNNVGFTQSITAGINISGKIQTILAKRYLPIDKLLFLPSNETLYDIELYNDNDNDLQLQMLILS